MNKFVFSFIILFIIGGYSKAQINVDFENINLGVQGYDNGSSLSGGFQSGGLFFVNNYNTQFGSWDSFAASGKTDTTTSGFTNQYSAFAGQASSGNKFAIIYEGYARPPVFLPPDFGLQKRLTSFKFTNSTYAALNMKNGDNVAKKFGGISGSDPDFFKVLVFNHFNGVKTDSAEILLADFRFTNSSQDYIVKNWRTATFNFSSPFDSISFRFQSSDNGTFGMNTPAYFCLDDLQYSNVTGIAEIAQHSDLKAFPNPFHNEIEIISKEKIRKIVLIDYLGRKVEVGKTEKEPGILLDTEKLVPGIYFVSINGKGGTKLVKK